LREKSHYEILGVPPLASLQEIKDAFRNKSSELHPDRNDGVCDPAYIRITEAYKILKDNEERRKYDMVLRLMWDACGDCTGTGVKFRQKGFTNKIRFICPTCMGVGFTSRG